MIPEGWLRAALSPPRAWDDGQLATGVLRAGPEDFVVEEILGFAASGSGPHALLQVRKRGANTEWVARELARATGCKPFDVGYAGLKDRHAITTQFFTVPRGARAAAEFIGLAGEGYEVLSAAEHQRKLPRGALEANRFDIRVRELRGDHQALRQRLERLRAGGAPNYFGAQRFGRDAGNLAAVLREAANNDSRPSRRDDRGFVLSAARSLIFNAILAERVRRGSWNRLCEGDVANLDGRGSVFAVDIVDEALAARCEAQEIHPTAPLVGDGDSLARGEVKALEEAVTAAFPEAVTVIRAARMRAERRATRIRIVDLHHDLDGDVLRLTFKLPAGSFATTVLREIISGSESGD
jgi:tRNA pseudouridine13 synthase